MITVASGRMCYGSTVVVKGGHRNTMPGFRHQTVFGLCLVLTVLAAVSVVCVAMLFIERQEIDLLQQNVTSLQQDNAVLRSQLNNYRSGFVTQQEAAARSSD